MLALLLVLATPKIDCPGCDPLSVEPMDAREEGLPKEGPVANRLRLLRLGLNYSELDYFDLGYFDSDPQVSSDHLAFVHYFGLDRARRPQPPHPRKRWNRSPSRLMASLAPPLAARRATGYLPDAAA